MSVGQVELYYNGGTHPAPCPFILEMSEGW